MSLGRGRPEPVPLASLSMLPVPSVLRPAYVAGRELRGKVFINKNNMVFKGLGALASVLASQQLKAVQTGNLAQGRARQR